MAIGPGIIPQSQHTGNAPLNWSRDVPTFRVKWVNHGVFRTRCFFLNDAEKSETSAFFAFLKSQEGFHLFLFFTLEVKQFKTSSALELLMKYINVYLK